MIWSPKSPDFGNAEVGPPQGCSAKTSDSVCREHGEKIKKNLSVSVSEWLRP